MLLEPSSLHNWAHPAQQPPSTMFNNKQRSGYLTQVRSPWPKPHSESNSDHLIFLALFKPSTALQPPFTTSHPKVINSAIKQQPTQTTSKHVGISHLKTLKATKMCYFTPTEWGCGTPWTPLPLPSHHHSSNKMTGHLSYSKVPCRHVHVFKQKGKTCPYNTTLGTLRRNRSCGGMFHDWRASPLLYDKLTFRR